jgi:hypothetical protein
MTGMSAPGPSQVPAATRALRVLRFLASQTDPVPLDRIARSCALGRTGAERANLTSPGLAAD